MIFYLMHVNQLPADQMSVDVNQMLVYKLSIDLMFAIQKSVGQKFFNQMSVDEMSVDEMYVDKMSVDEMSVDEMSVDEMSIDEII